MAFGEVLRKIRTSHKDSLRKLSYKTGIYFTKINKIEIGNLTISEENLKEFIRVYPERESELMEACAEELLPKSVYDFVKNKRYSEAQNLCEDLFRLLGKDEKKEFLKSSLEKFIYLNAINGKYEENKEKFEAFKKAIEKIED